MKNTVFIIAAAHENDGMASATPKIMHKLCGATLLEHVFDTVQAVTENKPILLLDSTQQAVAMFAADRAFAVEQGDVCDGRAIQLAAQHIPEKSEYVVVMLPDMPLLKAETLENLVEYTDENALGASVLAGDADDKIVCFNKQRLFEVLWTFPTSRDDLTVEEIIDAMQKDGHLGWLEMSEYEALRVMDRVDLAQAGKDMRREIAEKHMLAGVTFIDPDTTYIDKGVRIGADTVIYPNNYLEGDTVIGENCCLYPGNRLIDCDVHNGVSMQGVIATSAVMHDSVRLGPYTHLRPGTVLHDRAFAGAFVEMKNADFGEGSKAAHLAYVGDAKVGCGVNIGCGVVFVNYDGKHKHTSIVGDHAFVGSNSNLISPVTIGENGFVAAGSTVTSDVPSDALCIARSRQENKEGWVVRRNERDAQNK